MKVSKVTCPIGLFLALIVLAMAPFGAAYASGGNSAAGPITLEWSIDAQIVVHDSEAVELGLRAATSGTVDALVSKLAAIGIKAEKRAAGTNEKGMVYAVKASGSGDVESFRSLIYKDAKPQFHLLGGVTEMEINAPVQGRETVLVIESNLSTGYRWHVAAGSGMVESAPRTFEKHTQGRGAPERQTLRLTPTGASGPVKLVYKRAWENSVPTQHVKVTLSALPATLNLSDPGAPLGPQPALQSVVHNEAFPSAPPAGLPAHFDWRDQGIVTPVRDQGYCGSCWAFGTVGIMESALGKAGTTGVNLSEQFLMDCNDPAKNWDGTKWSCGYGGWTAHEYHYDTLGINQGTIGAVLEATKPYIGQDGTCTTNYDKPYILSGWQFITPSEFTMPTVPQIKSAIYTYGPITAGVCAGNGWDYYSGGTFTTDETSYCCNPVQDGCTNHQIIIVGWDDPGGYWILRNSWGTGWGVNGSGYMYIKYGISRVGEGPSWVEVNGSASPTLTVSKTGSGTVASSPAGINCGATCSASFFKGTAITLTATPAAYYGFTGWSGGGCSGTGACTVTMSSDVTVSATFATLPCTYALSLANKAFPYAGGAVNMTVTAKGVQCAAPGMASDPWISATLVGSFTNNTGTVKVTATANDTINGRKGTATIGGKTLNVAEAGMPCSITLSPASVNPTSAGGSGSFSVISPTGCGWTAVVGLGPKWLSISSGTPGSGNGTIAYSVSQNTTNLARLGRIRVNSTKNPIAVYNRFRVTQQK